MQVPVAYVVKAIVFLGVMYGCESWTDRKESWAQKNWCFWSVVLKKTLESPLDRKEIQPVHPKGDQSWIFIGRTAAKTEVPKLWPPMQRADSLEKILMLGKTEGKRRRGQQRMKWLDNITNSMDMNLRKLSEILGNKGAWPATVHGLQKSWIQVSDWKQQDLRTTGLEPCNRYSHELQHHKYSPLV